MERNRKFYIKLFLSTFYLSAFTFGGGYVIIAFMRKKFVEEYHWIEEKEMLEITSIAQSAPGAIAVNAAILVGYRLAGVIGSVIAIIGTVLPPLIILSMISVAYTMMTDNIAIQYVLRGMQAGVAAVIIDVVITMILGLAKEKKVFPFLIVLAAFIATYFFKINVFFVILVCGFLGAVSKPKEAV